MDISFIQQNKPILAMLHLKGTDPQDKLERAKREAAIYFENGVDAVIAEDYFGNYHDVENVLKFLQNEYPEKCYGVNILNNFHRSYELAAMYGASFMQVDSLAGHLPPYLDIAYGKMIEAYRFLGKVAVIGGVRFKYQPVLSGRTLEEDMALGVTRADAIVVTGEGTGMQTSSEKISAFRQLTKNSPLIVGAGMTPDTVKEKLSVADGAIVGSYFKDTYKDTGDVDPTHVKEFMEIVFQLRQDSI